MKTKKLTSFILTVAMVFGCLSLLPAKVKAYSLNGRRITSTQTYIPYSGFGSTTITHFNHAMYQWNHYSGQNLMNRSSTITHSRTDYPNDDGKNYIYAKNTGTTDYVGQTTTYYNTSTGVAKSSDINLNMYYSWANSAQPGKFDVWTVFLHETGHAAGMGHSSNSSAVMYPTVKRNHLNRSLTTDDINGIKAIYGTSTSSANNLLIDDSLDTIAEKSGTLVDYTIEELISDSNLIIRAKLKDASETFQIQSAEGEAISNFTDYYFEIEEIIAGECSDDTAVTVRIEGGTVDDFKLIVDEAPEVPYDSEVILFLYKPNMGSGFNTEGDYYYILGLNQGIFVNSAEKYSNDSMYCNENNDKLTVDELSQMISNSKTPAEGVDMYNEFLANAKANLEEGVITEEAYNEMVSLSRIYATKLD